MTVPGSAKQFQGQKGADGVRSRDHPGAGKSHPLKNLVQVQRSQGGQKKKQAAELGADLSRTQIEPTDIRHLGHRRMLAGRSLVVGTPGQPGETFGLQQRRHRHRTQATPFLLQRAADVIDGEVLFPQGNDLLAYGVALGGRLWPFGWRKKELAVWVLTEAMHQDAKATWGIAETGSRFGRREPFDEVGPQGLVLPMGGVGGCAEHPSQVR